MRICLGLALALFLLGASSVLAQDVTARFYPEKQQYLIGEPIIIVLEIVNKTDHEIEVSDGNCDWMRGDPFEVVGVPFKKETNLYGCGPVTRGISCGSGGVRLRPRGKLDRRLLLRGHFDEFDLAAPGTYHVKAFQQVRKPDIKPFDAQLLAEARSEFDITLRAPKDDEELTAAYQPFVAELQGGNLREEWFVASALTQDPPSSMESTVLSLVNNYRIEALAIHGLQRLGTPAARAKLIEIALHDGVSSRQQAIPALGKIGDRDDCDAILKIAADNVRVAQEEAYVAAGRICGEKGVGPLVQALPSASAELTWNIAAGLGNTGSRNAVQPLVNLLSSPNEFVRRSALDALFTLTHHGNVPIPSVEYLADHPEIHSEWLSWWAMNSQTAPIHSSDDCPK
jgi:HEAT repeats